MLRLIRTVLLAAFMLAMVGPSATFAAEPTHACQSSSLCAPTGSAAANSPRNAATTTPNTTHASQSSSLSAPPESAAANSPRNPATTAP
jgi:hypothetical protein